MCTTPRLPAAGPVHWVGRWHAWCGAEPAAGFALTGRVRWLRSARTAVVPGLCWATGRSGAGLSAVLHGWPAGLRAGHLPRPVTHGAAGLQGTRPPRPRCPAGRRTGVRAASTAQPASTAHTRGVVGTGAVSAGGCGSAWGAAHDGAGSAGGGFAGWRGGGRGGRPRVAGRPRGARLGGPGSGGSAGQSGGTGAAAPGRPTTRRHGRRADR